MADSNINAHELAERANVGQSFVYDILSGKSRNPTIEKLTAIAHILGVSPLYLMYGSSDEHVKNPAIPDDMITIPHLIARSNGSHINIETMEGIPNFFQLSWIKNQLKTDPADLRLVKVLGDTMSPTLDEDDQVLIDISKKSANPAGLFAIFDGVGITIKRLEYIGNSKPPMLRIISDNKKYEPYNANTDSVQILGRVVWLSRSLL